MNRTLCLSILLICFTATGLFAGEKPTQTTVTPDAPADLPRELITYYTHLVETDDAVQKQVARLTARSREKAGGLFKQWDEPRVVEWLPFSETRTNEGDTVHGHYLVIQLAGRWRTKDSDADMALVSEFDVHHDERTNKLTITFLGFRDLKLTALKQ
jgi:hypothetical protein